MSPATSIAVAPAGGSVHSIWHCFDIPSINGINSNSQHELDASLADAETAEDGTEEIIVVVSAGDL